MKKKVIKKKVTKKVTKKKVTKKVTKKVVKKKVAKKVTKKAVTKKATNKAVKKTVKKSKGSEALIASQEPVSSQRSIVAFDVGVEAGPVASEPEQLELPFDDEVESDLGEWDDSADRDLIDGDEF